MGMDRLGDHRGGPAAPPGSIDSRPDEGELETADRGEGATVHELAELQSNQPGAPGGVLPLERAAELEQFLGGRRDRATTGAIVGRQARALVAAGQPPDVPDRGIGDRQLRRDLGQGQALLMTAHDLLTERDREGARHGSRLRDPEGVEEWLTDAYLTHADEGS
jgi:hypothetical protein